MIVVSNTTPINYLVLIDFVHIVPGLFKRITVPPAVLNELASDDAPEKVKTWCASAPAWLDCQPAGPTPADLMVLHRGEAEAIALAERLRADLFLVDEARARRVARQRGLRVVGTLAVLDRAAGRGMADLAVAVERLRRTTFRVSPKLLDSFGAGRLRR